MFFFSFLSSRFVDDWWFLAVTRVVQFHISPISRLLSELTFQRPSFTNDVKLWIRMLFHTIWNHKKKTKKTGIGLPCEKVGDACRQIWIKLLKPWWDSPWKVGWECAAHSPKPLLCSFLLPYLWPGQKFHTLFMTVAAGTVALNTSYEGLLFAAILIMMKK